MSSGWVVSPLADVVRLKRGYDLPSQIRRPGSVPILGSFGITGSHDSAKVQGPGVTIGRSGASIGVATYSRVDFWPLNTALYVEDFKGNDPTWVYWLLHTIDFSAYNSGSAQPSLNRNFLANIPVAVPTFDEQRRIAEVLGVLDDLIEVNQKLASECSDLAESFWIEATSKSQSDRPLADCANLILGGTPSRKEPDFWGGQVPWLNSGKANEFRVTKPSEMITDLGLSKSSTKMMPIGATIVAITGATLGQISRIEISACGNQSLVGVWSDSPALNDFIFFGIRSRIEVLMQSATGGAQQHVNKANVEELRLPWLPEAQIQAWHIVAQPLLKATAELLFEAEMLMKARDELLPLLMSGRIRVAEDVAA
jgi:type I restriction enzyme S subunit